MINKAEGDFAAGMKRGGWEVTKRGWPDYICYKDGKIILVEVKPRRSHRLKNEQYRLMVALSKFNVPCYRWSPDGNVFERITTDFPNP